jgi:hypothetical protein
LLLVVRILSRFAQTLLLWMAPLRVVVGFALDYFGLFGNSLYLSMW